MEMLDIEVFEGGFKETELGPLPEEWEVVRLGDVVKIIKGKKPKILSKNPSKNSLPYLTAEYFRHGVPKQFVDIEVEKELPICKKEDVILIWDGSAGQVFSGFEGVLASTMVKVIPVINNLNKAYLYYFLVTKSNYLNSQTTGSVIPHINKTVFINLPLPLPPLEEQKAIAGILSTVQSAIEKTEKVINALKNLKKSMMKHLFTYRPVAEEEAEKVEIKETEIGLMPKHWEVVRLGEVVEIYDNKRVPLSENVRKNMKGIYPYCGANGIIDYINDYIFDGEYVLVAEDGGRYGKFENTAYIMNGKFWVNNHAHILQAKDGISINKFILYWFIYADISQYVAGTTRQKLTLSVLKSIPLPLPPLEEQQKIAQILQSIDQRIEKEEKYKNALQNFFKSLLYNLMTGKIRVRVKDHGED
jgi:type I restriction enzyme S subunit